MAVAFAGFVGVEIDLGNVVIIVDEALTTDPLIKLEYVFVEKDVIVVAGLFGINTADILEEAEVDEDSNVPTSVVAFLCWKKTEGTKVARELDSGDTVDGKTKGEVDALKDRVVVEPVATSRVDNLDVIDKTTGTDNDSVIVEWKTSEVVVVVPESVSGTTGILVVDETCSVDFDERDFSESSVEYRVVSEPGVAEERDDELLWVVENVKIVVEISHLPSLHVVVVTVVHNVLVSVLSKRVVPDDEEDGKLEKTVEE